MKYKKLQGTCLDCKCSIDNSNGLQETLIEGQFATVLTEVAHPNQFTKLQNLAMDVHSKSFGTDDCAHEDGVNRQHACIEPTTRRQCAANESHITNKEMSRLYDNLGNIRQWWDNVTIAKFEKKV
ncbi:unnamed protein product [Strongylus vulgaris]|uniref:Uncharacterized protein n=1 Tax=Strongylus vulgaris TaxID=40348 RepID=A0A3P7JJ40_STRVU|nr:unnamed protein product [Strongylus vulgaris]